MRKGIITIVLASIVAASCFCGCSTQSDDKTLVETTTIETTSKLTTEKPSTVEATTEEPITTNETESEPEPNTSEMVDYIAHKAKADAETAKVDDKLEAIQWLKDNIDNIFDNNENMEKTMYYGELLEYCYKGTGNSYEKVGWQAFKTVKYVYRLVESVSDTVTQDNYDKLKEMLK